MRTHFPLAVSCILLFSFGTRAGSEETSGSAVEFAPFPLEVQEQDALMAAWEKKEVLKSKMIDDFEANLNWQVHGIGEMSYTEERARNGKRSLRFRTSLRDEGHYRRNRTPWGAFGGNQGGSSSIEIRFAEPQDWSGFNRISFWAYVHPTSMPTYAFSLRLRSTGAVSSATNYNNKSSYVEDLKPGEWNHVLFEIPHLQRDKVTSFSINQMLTGHHPEEEGIVTYDFDQLEIELVEADQYEGWTVARNKFSYSHIGYRPNDPKIALAGDGAAGEFQLVDGQGKSVFSGNVDEITNAQGTFRVLDFSEFKKIGTYRLKCGSLESNPFPIRADIWVQPIFKALNFFWCERCGYHVPGVHLECHKDWQGFRGEERKIINGGWHDAGDLSQGSWRTSMSTLALMMNLERFAREPEYSDLAKRLQDEVAWGVAYLLKTRFGDGYHMSFSVMRIYTDNEVGTMDDVVSPAQNVPWENFLAAAVQAKAATILRDYHPELAEESRKAALEDWQAAVDSREAWDGADYREAAWGATSSILLGKMTGDGKYNKYAVQFGGLLVKCQQQTFVEGIPITGYFYTSTDRRQVIHNYHTAFEEAPLMALAALCREFPGHEDWMEWYSAVVLHSEFFMKRGSRIASPYDLLPNSVWKREEILDDDAPPRLGKSRSFGREEVEQQRRDRLRQFDEGTFLNDDFVLRTFPIYHDDLFHGNTNIHMSSTWALAEASRLRQDSEGMQLVGKQFNWLFGGNPFSQSLMYGEGHDFAPHFAYCLKDLVGALPVGMDCHSGDDPHWSATNGATYKEMWVEPVNRFLGALSIYLSETEPSRGRQESADGINVQAEAAVIGNDVVRVALKIAGEGEHVLCFAGFNIESAAEEERVRLSQGKPLELTYEMRVVEPGKPYILVLEADNDPDLRWEVVGSLVDFRL